MRAKADQWLSIARRPSSVIETLVFGLRSTKALITDTKPASSSLVRCEDRLPFVRPVIRRKNMKSALAHEARVVMIKSRAGSWMSLSSASSSLIAGHRAQRTREDAVIDRAAGDRGEPHEHKQHAQVPVEGVWRQTRE